MYADSLVAQIVKRPPAMQETRVPSLGQEDPLEKEMHPTPVLLPGKPHGWRNLMGHTPQGHKEAHTTERLLSLSEGKMFKCKTGVKEEWNLGRGGRGWVKAEVTVTYAAKRAAVTVNLERTGREV